MDKYIFEKAKPFDSAEILQILEETVFRGDISITYSRRPDAYTSIKSEGEEVEIFVCRDIENRKIAGIGAVAVNTLFINGKPTKAAYLFSLRARKEYMHKNIGFHRVYRTIFETFKHINLFYTTILEENTEARKLLEKQRNFMPIYRNAGRYTVYAISPQKSVKTSSDFQFSQINYSKACEFLNNYGADMQFFPFLSHENTASIESFNERQYFQLSYKNEPVAAGALWNQQSYKQHIVADYSKPYALASKFGGLLKFFGFPKLPAKGEKFNYCSLAHFVVKDNNTLFAKQFIEHFAQLTREQKFDFFVVGFHQSNSLAELAEQISKVKYKSIMYFVSPQNSTKFELENKRTIYLECANL